MTDTRPGADVPETADELAAMPRVTAGCASARCACRAVTCGGRAVISTCVSTPALATSRANIPLNPSRAALRVTGLN